MANLKFVRGEEIHLFPFRDKKTDIHALKLNDKTLKTVSIILEENILNISNIDKFKEHMNEFCPAWYEVIVKNNT